jgi:hypothetical protein
MASPFTKQDASEAAGTNTLDAVQDRPAWVNYVLAWTFCVQAVLIGTILSTAPLLLHDALGLGVLHVGFAFAGTYLFGLTHDPANRKKKTLQEVAAEPLEKQGQHTFCSGACQADSA